MPSVKPNQSISFPPGQRTLLLRQDTDRQKGLDGNQPIREEIWWHCLMEWLGTRPRGIVTISVQPPLSCYVALSMWQSHSGFLPSLARWEHLAFYDGKSESFWESLFLTVLYTITHENSFSKHWYHISGFLVPRSGWVILLRLENKSHSGSLL